MNCTACNREATYDVPTNLCDEHWTDWCLKGYDEFLSPDEFAKERQDILDLIWSQHGKPKDW